MDKNYKVGDLIYDAAIYDGMNTNLSDLQFYKRWLPKNKEARILELCCGTGRLTLPIAKEGYNISGVDYTSSMLEQAKVKATEAGLNIEFIEADIRGLVCRGSFSPALHPPRDHPRCLSPEFRPAIRHPVVFGVSICCLFFPGAKLSFPSRRLAPPCWPSTSPCRWG